MTAEADALSQAHRTIRVVPPGEGPYAGRLVAGGDEPYVAVRTHDLKEWGGWARGEASHLAVPAELVRTAEGHEVLLPWCTERLDAFVARREAAAAPLTPGECTTLLASLLRGAAEAGEVEPRGEWWLTASARPVFVIGAGEALTTEAVSIVRQVAEASQGDRAIGRLCARITEVLGERRRIPHEAAGVEEMLCAWAAPKPLGQVPVESGEKDDWTRTGSRLPLVSPAEAARVVRSRSAESDPARAARPSGVRRRRAADRPHRGRPFVDGLLARAHLVGTKISEKAAGIRGRRRGSVRTGARRPEGMMTRRWSKPLLVAAVVAAVLAVGGALWPSGSPAGTAATVQDGSSALPTRAGEPTPSDDTTSSAGRELTRSGALTSEKEASASPSPSRSTTPSPGEETDPVVALPALLGAAAQCKAGRGDESGAEACARAWSADRDPSDRDAVDLSPEASLRLIENFGDLAAIRVESGPEVRMVILVRTDDGWRIRDVYDVADPPSGEGVRAGDQIPS